MEKEGIDILEREVGAIPISIGTSLAFEALFGIHPNQPQQTVNVKTVKELWINLKTLVRNLYQAVPTANQASIPLNTAIDLLVDEIKLMPFIVTQYNLMVKLNFYYTDKEDVKWSFPKAKFKEAKTPKQIAYRFYEDYVTAGLIQRLLDETLPTTHIKSKPPRITSTVALLTHFPHELLWRDSFDRLLLLESHTGRLKPYNLWYTKLNGITGTDAPIPFNKYTLQVYGDSIVIDAQPKNIKAQLKQLALSRKWSPVTTPDKFYHDITTHGTKELIENYKLLR